MLAMLCMGKAIHIMSAGTEASEPGGIQLPTSSLASFLCAGTRPPISLLLLLLLFLTEQKLLSTHTTMNEMQED